MKMSIRALSLALLLATIAGIAPTYADPCQIQTVRSVQGQTICIYNCAGTIRTVTTAGSICPVILE